MVAHDKEWPDKVMFAALLLVVAGCLAVVFGALRMTGATLDEERLPRLLVEYPAGLELGLGVVTALLGLVSWRYQASVWAYFGVVTGIASLGFLGMVPVLAGLALVGLVLSRVEGEETRHDEHTVDSSLWPDKALSASLFLLVTGVVAVFQGVAIFIGRWPVETILQETPWVLASFSVAAGVWCVYACTEVFRPRRAWTGWVGAAAGFLTLGFYVLAPALALVAMLFLRLAHREGEFEADAPAGGAA